MLWNECYSSFKVVYMKKLILIITFIFACFVFSFKSSASYLPPTLPQTQVVPDFLQSVTQTQLMENGVYCDSNDINHLNQLINGRSVDSSRSECYVDNANLSELSSFYDSNGNLISQDNTYTAFGNSDLGRYMFVADKSTGEILSTYDSLNHYQSTLVASGDNSLTFPQFVFEYTTLVPQYLADEIINRDFSGSDSSMVVYGNNLTQENIAYVEAYDFHYIFHSNNCGWTLYVPNACSLNTVIDGGDFGSSYSGELPNPCYTTAPRIFSNDPSEVYFSGGGAWGYLRSEPSYYFGQNWTYCEGWRNIYNPCGSGGFLEFKSPSQADFDRYKSLSDSVVYLQPIINEGDTNNVYEYTTLVNNPPSRHTTVNNNYDNSQPVTNNNYFINNTTSIPDYTPSNNYYQNIYNYYTTPQQGDSIGSIDDPIIPENIPILSNLEYRFPFSIPFDLYKLAKGLSVPRETPYIDTIIVIPGINYSWHLEYDLHDFDNVAELFRLLELILFIVALAVFSYDHFFGS